MASSRPSSPLPPGTNPKIQETEAESGMTAGESQPCPKCKFYKEKTDRALIENAKWAHVYGKQAEKVSKLGSRNQELEHQTRDLAEDNQKLVKEMAECDQYIAQLEAMRDEYDDEVADLKQQVEKSNQKVDEQSKLLQEFTKRSQMHNLSVIQQQQSKVKSQTDAAQASASQSKGRQEYAYHRLIQYGNEYFDDMEQPVKALAEVVKEQEETSPLMSAHLTKCIKTQEAVFIQAGFPDVPGTMKKLNGFVASYVGKQKYSTDHIKWRFEDCSKALAKAKKDFNEIATRLQEVCGFTDIKDSRASTTTIASTKSAQIPPRVEATGSLAVAPGPYTAYRDVPKTVTTPSQIRSSSILQTKTLPNPQAKKAPAPSQAQASVPQQPKTFATSQAQPDRTTTEISLKSKTKQEKLTAPPPTISLDILTEKVTKIALETDDSNAPAVRMPPSGGQILEIPVSVTADTPTHTQSTEPSVGPLPSDASIVSGTPLRAIQVRESHITAQVIQQPRPILAPLVSFSWGGSGRVGVQYGPNQAARGMFQPGGQPLVTALGSPGTTIESSDELDDETKLEQSTPTKKRKRSTEEWERLGKRVQHGG